MARPTKILILTMILVTGIGVLIAWLYYRAENAAEDPRIAGARILLTRYDRLMTEGRYEEAFPLLDSVERIVSSLPCYSESYEMGVVYNNRGSAWISMALYREGDSVRKNEWLTLAGESERKAIAVYSGWLDRYRHASKTDLRASAQACFRTGDSIFRYHDREQMIRRRVSDMELAQIENLRRLSVAWSNLGIIQRHLLRQDSAVACYIKALELWKKNPVARNNLNTLLGRPPEDESVIERLFPPDRRKAD